MDGITVPHLRSRRRLETTVIETDTNLLITLVSLGAVAFVSFVICLLVYCLRGKKLWGKSSEEQWYFQGPTKEMGPFSRSRMRKHLARNIISPQTMVRFSLEIFAPLETFYPDGCYFVQTPATQRRGSMHSVYSRVSTFSRAQPASTPADHSGRVKALPESAFSPNYAALARPPARATPESCPAGSSNACPGPWFYKPSPNNVHGPFEAEQMRLWFRGNFLPLNLPISLGRPSGPFASIQSVFPQTPFGSKPNLAVFASPYGSVPFSDPYPQSCKPEDWRQSPQSDAYARYGGGHADGQRTRDPTAVARAQSAKRSRPEMTEAGVPHASRDYMRAQSAARCRPGTNGGAAMRSSENWREQSAVRNMPESAARNRADSAARNMPEIAARNRAGSVNKPMDTPRGNIRREGFENAPSLHSGRVALESGTSRGAHEKAFLSRDAPENTSWAKSMDARESADREGKNFRSSKRTVEKENADPEANGRRGVDHSGRRPRGKRPSGNTCSSSESGDSQHSRSRASELERERQRRDRCREYDRDHGHEEPEKYRPERNNVGSGAMLTPRQNPAMMDRLEELRVRSVVQEEPVSTAQVAVLRSGNTISSRDLPSGDSGKRASMASSRHPSRQPRSGNLVVDTDENLPTLNDFLAATRKDDEESSRGQHEWREQRRRRREERSRHEEWSGSSQQTANESSSHEKSNLPDQAYSPRKDSRRQREQRQYYYPHSSHQ